IELHGREMIEALHTPRQEGGGSDDSDLISVFVMPLSTNSSAIISATVNCCSFLSTLNTPPPTHTHTHTHTQQHTHTHTHRDTHTHTHTHTHSHTHTHTHTHTDRYTHT